MEKYTFWAAVLVLMFTVYLITYSLMAVGVTITLIGIAVYVSELLEQPLLPFDWNFWW
jgi:hypothetical protein